MSNALYDQDFYAWTNEQAALLRARKLSDLDIENIAEEIESMGRAARNELTSRLAVLLTHLLKWTVQPERRSRSWLLSIREQRRQVARHIKQSPSLRPQFAEIMADAYGDALLVAQRQTKLPEEAFPAECPWTFDEAMTTELDQATHGEPASGPARVTLPDRQ
jgi:hypothetical protein